MSIFLFFYSIYYYLFRICYNYFDLRWIMRKVNVVAALIEKNGCFLLAQRAGGSLKGKWEFPGGKVEENETEDA